MKEKKSILMTGGHGVVSGRMLDRADSMELAMEVSEPPKLKLTPEEAEKERMQEIRKQLRAQFTDEVLQEYLLIKQKKSDLPRQQRDRLVFNVEFVAKMDILTDEERSKLQL